MALQNLCDESGDALVMIAQHLINIKGCDDKTAATIDFKVMRTLERIAATA